MAWRGCLVGLACVCFLSGCGREMGPLKVAAAEPAGPTVVVAVVEQKTVPIFSEYVARTDASATVEIRARVEGLLLEQHFEEGRAVAKGELLFTIENTRYTADLESARAALAKAQAQSEIAKSHANVQKAGAQLRQFEAVLGKTEQDVKRLTPLAAEQAVPQQDLDNALAAQKSALADVESSRANLNDITLNQKTDEKQAESAIMAAQAAVRQAELYRSYCDVRSPIAGLIGRREVAPGNLVGRGEATLLATVSSLDPLRVYFSVSEVEFLGISRYVAQHGFTASKAPPLSLILADGSVHPHPGKFIIADRAVDPKTGTMSLIGEFPNPGGVVRPGQFGRVRLAMAVDTNAILVPQKAVGDIQGVKTVLVVDEANKVSLRTVVIGNSVGSQYVIKEGLKAGERIITEGIQKARPGATVRPVTQPMTSESVR